MARKKAAVEYNDFTGGFITEASPLTYPENASLDEENVNINRDGTRQRRFGMDWTDVADTITQATDLSASTSAISSHSWFSANNDGTSNFGILQHGYNLYFYDLDAEDPSQTLLHTEVLTPTFADSTRPYSYTSAYGKLLIASGREYINVISWNGSSFTKSDYRLSVRDRWGIDDGLDVDTQSATLSNNHEYNLRNQGFPDTMKCVGDEHGLLVSIFTNPINYTFTKQAVYPSNADLVWSARLGIIAPASVQTDNIDAYSPWELTKQIFGTTPAPKGKAIIDVFKRQQTSSSLGRFAAMFPIGSPITEDYSVGRITSVSAFAGRIWYTLKEDSLVGGDDQTPNIGNMVLFSHSTEDQSRWGSCHTLNDPTAEILNDVLESDGGFISIPEAGEVYKAIPLGESLFVFASNGVWEIFGGDTTFSATQQSVLKITDKGVIAERSIITGENLIGYWSETGIFGVNLQEGTLRGLSTNITESTIQSYYDDIPIALKKAALGSFDSLGRQVTWLHSLEDLGSDYYHNKELIFDLNRSVFTKRSVNNLTKTLGHGPYPVSTLNLKKLVSGSTQEVITDGGVDVTDGGVDVTITTSDAEQGTKTSLMYWIADYNGTNEIFRLGGYLDFTFTDYPRIEDSSSNFGSDASAFILTGYLTGGDSSRTKWAPYITVKMKRTETDWTVDGSGNIEVIGESSCTMQAQWQWTNDPLSGFWSTAQQVYRLPRLFTIDHLHNFSFDVINTRNKVKGSGDALSLRFTSSPLKDMVLYGWGIDVELAEKV